MDLKESFKGEEFWRKMNFGMFFIVYAFFFVMMAMPQYSKTMIIGLGFFIAIYIAFQQWYFRMMDKKNRGKTVQKGWATHAYGVGEEYELPKVKYEPIQKLSSKDKASVDKFINDLIMGAQEKRREMMPDLMGNIQPEQPQIEDKTTNQEKEENKGENFNGKE